MRRRWRWSLLVKIEGDPLNTQHAQEEEEEEEEEEEAVFISVVNTNEDPPNAHQAQHRRRRRRRQSLFVVLTQMRVRPTRNMRHIAPFKTPVRWGRRRRRRLSLLVIIEGDPLNTQHAQHRPVQATDRSGRRQSLFVV